MNNVIPLFQPSLSEAEEELQLEADQLRKMRRYAARRLNVITRELVELQMRRLH